MGAARLKNVAMTPPRPSSFRVRGGCRTGRGRQCPPGRAVGLRLDHERRITQLRMLRRSELTALEDPAAGALRDPQRGQSRARLPRGRASVSAGVPARPRPHHPQHGVPPPRVQDAGLRQPRGRLLPHAADAHDGGGADHAHHRPGAAPEPGSGRSGGAGARPRAHAVRARRRARPERADGAVRRLRAQRPEPAHRRRARGALPGLSAA